MQKEQADKLFMDSMNKLRRMDLRLTLRRFYVIKNKIDKDRNGKVYEGELKEGEKLRPIGAPEMPSRVVSKSFNDLIMVLFWDKFSRHQHGYRRNKGTHTALYGIINYLRKNKEFEIYEFDFKSFFNTIRPSWVYRVLLGRSKIVAELIMRILLQVEYKFKTIEKEAELVMDYKVEHNGKILPHIVRRGLPQGLSLSPLLSTLVLEMFKAPKGLFMYADDGLFIGTLEMINKFKKWLQDVELTGATIAKEKTGMTGRVLKFLGCTIDRDQEIIIMQDGTKFSFWTKNLKSKLSKHAPNQYKKRNEEEWSWQIEADSYLGRFVTVEGLGIGMYILIFLNSIIKKRSYKGYRFFMNTGFVDTIASSSECLGILMDYSKGFNLKNKKALDKQSFITGNKFGNWEMDKGYGGTPYIEAIYENQIVAFGKKKLPEFKNLFTQYFQ